MKNKVFVLIMCLTMALCFLLTGCGSKKVAQSAESAQPDTNLTEPSEPVQEQQAQEAEKPGSVEVTQENLTSFPVTPEEYFSTSAVDGGVSVTSCDYDGQVIVVPETLYGEKVVEIAFGAFSSMTMEGVVIPDTVEVLGVGAFEMCHELKYVHLGSGLKSVDSMAFDNCTSLVLVEFPEGMKMFTGTAFNNCDVLTEVIVPASVDDIPLGIMNPPTCPNAVIVTPAGSHVEADCIEYEVPYRNS